MNHNNYNIFMKTFRKQLLSFALLMILSLIIVPASTPALADVSLIDSQVGINEIGSAYGGRVMDVRVIVARIIILALQLLGVIFLSLLIFAGFQWMTAAGNEDKTKKAMTQIKNAVIGLIIVLASWALTLFIIRALDLSIKGYKRFLF